MTSSRRILNVSLGVSLVLVLALSSGCAWFAPKPPREAKDMIQTGMANFVKQGGSDVHGTLKIDLLGKDTANKPQSGGLDLTFDGDSVGFSGLSSPSFNLTLKGSLSSNNDVYKASADIHANDKNYFAKLNELTGPDRIIPKELVATTIGSWWKIPLPNSFYQRLGEDPGIKNYVAQLQGVYQVAMDYVKDVSYEGTDKIGGVESYHYSTHLDTGKLKAFLEGSSRSRGAQMTVQDIKDFNDTMDNLSGDVDFWVSMNGEILDRVVLGFKIGKIPGDNGTSAGKGNISLDLAFSNFGKVIQVQEPADSKEFDLFGLTGLFQSGASSSSSDGLLPPVDPKKGDASSKVPVKTPVKVPVVIPKK